MTARLKDIAKAANCSVGVVSAALCPDGTKKIRISPEKRELIKEIARKLNYQPNLVARKLVGKGGSLIGVLASFDAAPVTERRINYLQRFICDSGYFPIVSRFPFQSEIDRLERHIRQLSQLGIEGLIIIGDLMHGELRRQKEKLAGYIPSVHICNSPLLNWSGHTVSMDVCAGSAMTVKLLGKVDCKRAGLAVMNAERLSFFQNAGGAILFLTPEPASYGQTISLDQAKELVKELILRRKAETLIAENDYWAAMLCRACADMGISVPDDAGVIGYNNLDFAEFTSPPLTTFDEDDETITGRAFSLLLRLISGAEIPEAERNVIVPPRLVVRSSWGKNLPQGMEGKNL
jgi:DNA-binding LacI/PurR family transcriptional regulator